MGKGEIPSTNCVGKTGQPHANKTKLLFYTIHKLTQNGLDLNVRPIITKKPRREPRK